MPMIRSRPDRPGETTNPTVDLGALAADSLDAGLAAGFGKNSGPPRSSLGDMRPVLLKEAEGESSLRRQAEVRRHAAEGRGRRPLPASRRDRPRRHGGRAARPRRRPGPRPGGQGAAGEVRQPARRRAAVHRGGADRRAVAAPRRGAGLRHRPLRRPAVLHHEAGQGPDARGAPGRTDRPVGRPAAPAGHRACRCRRRWRTPTPRG